MTLDQVIDTMGCPPGAYFSYAVEHRCPVCSADIANEFSPIGFRWDCDDACLCVLFRDGKAIEMVDLGPPQVSFSERARAFFWYLVSRDPQ
jgi:hypothetical protein